MIAFHSGETEAQRRWRTTARWDQARKGRLLWDHIPPELHSRIERAPFFFLATSDSEGRCDCSFKGGGPALLGLFTDAERVVIVSVEQVVPNCARHIPRLVSANEGQADEGV